MSDRRETVFQAVQLGVTPSLAVALDHWGQTVAYRAGCNARPEWSPGARVRGLREHDGLSISTDELAANWRRAIRGQTGYPVSAQLSPWVTDILRAAEPGSGLRGRPHDVSNIACSFLTASNLLTTGQGRARASRRCQSAVTWMFAAPHYSDADGLIATWCHHQGRSSDAMIAAVTLEVKVWLRIASRRIGGVGRGAATACASQSNAPEGSHEPGSL